MVVLPISIISDVPFDTHITIDGSYVIVTGISDDPSTGNWSGLITRPGYTALWEESGDEFRFNNPIIHLDGKYRSPRPEYLLGLGIWGEGNGGQE